MEASLAETRHGRLEVTGLGHGLELVDGAVVMILGLGNLFGVLEFPDVLACREKGGGTVDRKAHGPIKRIC